MSVACVIPAYKQPGLLAEALASVMAQSLPGVAAIVVDDGCPMPETREVALETAARHPGRVHVLRQRNGGLSAARNTGIDYALAALPEARAIYMLDADNRIAPPFLERGLALLDDSPAGTGWLYPDIDSLGGLDCSDCSGSFSKLSLLLDNYCEAGSLLRRDMLVAGLRYDETLRQGWEDVEFWLRGVEAGWVGRHWPEAGFRYRRRAESMLAESDRIVPQLRAAMWARHPALYDHRNLSALEAAEAPRHAIISGDTVRIVHDPAGPGTAVDRPDWPSMLWDFQANPAARHHPYALVFAEAAVLDALGRAGLLHWVFWLGCLSLRQGTRPTVGFAIRPGDRIALRRDDGPLENASILFVRAQDLLRDAERPRAPEPIRFSLDFPGAVDAPGLPMAGHTAEREAVRRGRADAPRRPWRRIWRVSRDEMAGEALARHGIGQTLALRPQGRGIARRIGIIQPLHTRGGVERVLLAQATVLRRAGWEPHLFVTQASEIDMLPGMAGAYVGIHLLGITGREAWTDEERPYFGAETSSFNDHPGAADALGALAAMDVVVNTHALAGHALAGRLRKLGIRTVLGLHLTERGPFGEPLGQAHTALAYEHAYQMATVISGQMRAWCLAQGWPEDKLMLLRNAPGYVTEMAPPLRAPGGRLRAVFLGRLDAQKGLERLAATIAATRDFVDWRVAGKPILTGAPPAFGVPIEPPAGSAAEIDAILAWADILYMPSRFEGVPLTILEAQRLGCVPVATDVGAVAEIVRHGEDGWLLPGQAPDAAVVQAAVAALRALDADRGLLGRMSAAAAARLATARWEDTMREWMAWLECAA